MAEGDPAPPAPNPLGTASWALFLLVLVANSALRRAAGPVTADLVVMGLVALGLLSGVGGLLASFVRGPRRRAGAVVGLLLHGGLVLVFALNVLAASAG